MHYTTFNNFAANLACGADQTAMSVNKYAADYIPIHNFHNTIFNNVDDAAIIYIYNPPNGWATIDNCGEWPCTAPNNIVLNFDGSQNFQIVSNTNNNRMNTDKVSAPATYGTCVEKDAWNAWRCEQENIGVLLFESMDGDTWDRSVQPITFTNDNGAGNDYINTVNSMMDHVWDGFYTGQTRLSRFPVQLETGQDYHMRLTGTPPGNLRFRLDSSALKGV